MSNSTFFDLLLTYMQVFKFGGASVKDADGIKNLAHIVSQNLNERLVVVVSAMGKTTNLLEQIHAAYFNKNISEALSLWQTLADSHLKVVEQLEINSQPVEHYLTALRNYIVNINESDFDTAYDAIVSHGELLSTTIVSTYLNRVGISNLWLDMTKLLLTDSNHREANVIFQPSADNLKIALQQSDLNLFVVQGFIGGDEKGNPTTLGREGSDYTAAVVANLLDAQSVTIWKDVDGIMNADPKLFSHVIHIPELSYNDAVELAYSGAQIIHPKTIRPIENKDIPLYVKPFANPDAKGSVIKSKISKPISVPVYILRKNQVLVTIRPKDFSFVLEPSLAYLFKVVDANKLKVSLIQSSAVTISICVDNSRNLPEALEELSRLYNVTYNDNLCLLTIRGTTLSIIQEVEQGKDVLLKQTTRRTLKLVYRNVE